MLRRGLMSVKKNACSQARAKLAKIHSLRDGGIIPFFLKKSVFLFITGQFIPLSRDDEYPAACPAFFINAYYTKRSLLRGSWGLRSPASPGEAGALIPRGLSHGSSLDEF
jgi:hypothetical protein